MVSSQVVQVGKELLHVKDETGEIISRALTKGGKLGTLDLQGALDEAIRQRTISGKLDIKVRRLQFLYDPYEPKFWYFELVECARRLTFTAVIGFVSNGSVLQVIVSMLLAIMFVRIYNATSPFVKDSHDSLAEIAQWATFLTMFCALVIKSQENGGVEEENSSWVDLALVGNAGSARSSGRGYTAADDKRKAGHKGEKAAIFVRPVRAEVLVL